MKVGYARTSSLQQVGGLETQVKKLEEYGCEKIFKEQVSGTSTDGRDQLKACLNFVGKVMRLFSSGWIGSPEVVLIYN